MSVMCQALLRDQGLQWGLSEAHDTVGIPSGQGRLITR